MEPENDRDEVPRIEPPATPEQREVIKNELINKDGPATKMQINSLKKILKQLREVDPNREEFIAAIAQKTDNFTNITKSACEQLILKIGEMIEEANQEVSS